MSKLTPRNVLVLLDLSALLVQRATEALAIGKDIPDAELAMYVDGDDESRARLQAKIDAARAARQAAGG